MRIGVIGYFGGEYDFTDGQTVKTKALVEGFHDQGYSNLQRDSQLLQESESFVMI